MNFEWDDEKSEACFRDRGFDFAYSAHAFFDPQRLIVEDTRHSYGEDRYQLIGVIEQRPFRCGVHKTACSYSYHFSTQSE